MLGMISFNALHTYMTTHFHSKTVNKGKDVIYVFVKTQKRTNR